MKKIVLIIILMVLVNPINAIAVNTEITEGRSGTYLISQINTTRHSFLDGLSNQTEFNDVIDAITLSSSKIGIFLSQVFNAYSNATWNSISWKSNGMGELPDSGRVETNPSGADMTGNVILMHMNEQNSNGAPGGADVEDFSGNQNHGEELGEVIFGESGKLGNALSFDGMDDFIVVSDSTSLNITDAITLEAWIKILSPSPDGTVKSKQKISSTEGGFTGVLDNKDEFGASIAGLDDLDGDGIRDIAIGAPFDDDGGSGMGAVWILFLNKNGTVKSQQKISSTEGGFTGVLDNFNSFGRSVANLDDLDGDGTQDIVVGAPFIDEGEVWILFLNKNGTVKSQQKISNGTGGFTGTTLDIGDFFGWSVANLGDLDGDNVQDIAVGAPEDSDGGLSAGAVWVLFLNNNGTVKFHQKISDTEGDFTGRLEAKDFFGHGVSGLHDLDGDGTQDIVVGAPGDDDPPQGTNRKSVWILFLNNNGTVKYHQKISNNTNSTERGGFTGTLDGFDWFGNSVTNLGDVDGDGLLDIAVGAFRSSDGDEKRGAVWILFLNTSLGKVVEKEGAYGLSATTTSLTGFINNKSLSVSDTLTGEFNHVSLTYDGSSQRLYHNGRLVISNLFTDQINTNNNPLLIGKLFNGRIDEVAIFNRSLSATEILEHYKRGVLKLNFTVRGCDDSACVGEDFNEAN